MPGKTAAAVSARAQSRIAAVNAAAAYKLYADAPGNRRSIEAREADSAAQSKLAAAVNIFGGLLEMKIPRQCPAADSLILLHCGGRVSLAALTRRQWVTNVHASTAKDEDLKSVFG